MKFNTVVTFEADGVVEPAVRRAQIEEKDVDQAARKAIFRALAEVGRMKWQSVVVTLEKVK